MTSRERLELTLNHKQPDKVVMDLGSTVVTGISAIALTNLREALGLEKRPVKILDPMQMIGVVEEDVMEALGADVACVISPYTCYGYKNENWKEWRMHGKEFLVGGNFEWDTLENGDIVAYPCGDRTAHPSARMPKGGYYFDNIIRQGSIESEDLNAREDYANDHPVMSDEVVESYKEQTDYYYNNTEYGINVGGFLISFGDAAPLPGPGQKVTKGIRDMEDWLIAHYTEPDYIKEVYAQQLENGLETLKKLKAALGDKPNVIQISGTDFGTQRCEFIAPDMYREFYKPLHAAINDWVHANTNWKIMYHTCGSVVNLLDDFVEIGMDIINPVQCSAAGMDPRMLKEKYGDKLVFWGGAAETQGVLSYGTAEEVEKEVRERLEIFAPGGGFVFNAVHNVQAQTPPENLIAMYKALAEYNAKH